MNNEYESGRYGQYLKFFQNNEDYDQYRDSSITIKLRPNVSWVEEEEIVNYNWERKEAYVLTPESNPVVWRLLAISNIEPSSPEGFTREDLAAITLDQLYDREGTSGGLYNEDLDIPCGWGELTDEQREGLEFSDIGLSIFYMYNCGHWALQESITLWQFPEFKYFTSITEIPNQMFSNCDGMTSITLPSSITSVGYYAFHDCRHLKEIILLSTPEFDVTSLTFTGWDYSSDATNVHIYSDCLLKCSEDIYEYYEDEEDIIDMNTVNVLWSDLSIYTVSLIINNEPEEGDPIGINIEGDKYVSLLYMSKNIPEIGSSIALIIPFGKFVPNASNNPTENNITAYTDVSLESDACSAYIGQRNKLLRILPDLSLFPHENGKQLTLTILNNVSSNAYQTSATINANDDYPVAECAWRFNPGDTNLGDWYIPEIGELVKIYLKMPVINYICNILYNKGYDVYRDLSTKKVWASTFAVLSTNNNPGNVFCKHMTYSYIETGDKSGNLNVAIAMYEIQQLYGR